MRMIFLKKDFFKSIEENLSLKLDENQRKAVMHESGPALVLAVPGAGKTTVLISRIAYLVNCLGADENSILSITFSRSSANDMKERFDCTYGEAYGMNARFSTIHSFSYMVLRDYFSKNRMNYSLIEGVKGQSKNTILRNIYREVNDMSPSDDKLEELNNRIGFVKNMMIEPSELGERSIKNFEDIFYRYEEFKKENLLIDFDDMLSMTLEVLKNDSGILNKYRRRYKYIQVDEAQDTSTLQHKIIETLAYPENNIFIVADDDQSIYGFRGANPEYLLNFKKRFKNAEIFYMSTNYRSTETIVSASNNFIQQNSARYEKNLIANNKKSSTVKSLVFNDQTEQYDFILDNIDIEDLEDSAILFRNNLSSIPIIDKLDRLGIGFYMKEIKLNFFNHWVVRDIISFFNLIVDNTDKSAFEKVYYKMNAFISKKAMNYVMKSKSSESVFSILESFDGMKHFQKQNIRNLGLEFSKLGKHRPAYIIEYIESDLDYLSYIDKRAEYLGQSSSMTLSYFSVLKVLASRTVSVLDFLTRIEELKNIIMNSKDGKGIFLSTIHSAKGLEFKNVFIVDLINGEFPSSSSLDIQKKGEFAEIEEERRVFYVGITRAKENLYLLSYTNRSNSYAPVSDFLKNIKYFMNESGSSELFSPGDEVEHKKFGRGTVLKSDSRNITVDFGKGKPKTFARDIVVEKNLLK